MSTVSRPTNFAPHDESGSDSFLIGVTNTGDAPSDGSLVTITDELPLGLSLDPRGAHGENELWHVEEGSKGVSRTPAENFTCLADTCTYDAVVIPDQTLLVEFPVDVGNSPPASCPVPRDAVSCVTNIARVSGGGAADASRETPTVVSAHPAAFGISPGSATTAVSTTQAGAHADLTNSLAFNTVTAAGSLAGDPKTVKYDLPPGFAGADLIDTPTCTVAEFIQRVCPIGSQIGVTTVNYIGVRGLGKHADLDAVFNLAPNPGAAAKIGFFIQANEPVEGDIYVRGDGGPEARFENIPQGAAELDNVSLTLWGVPAAHVHDELRKRAGTGSEGAVFGEASQADPRPFFTNPTSCPAEEPKAVITPTSWTGETTAPQTVGFGPISGCDHLVIEPSLTAQLTTPFASSASGLNVLTTLGQTYESPFGLATSHMREADVTLPEDITVNPSAGVGLGACSPQQLQEEGVVEEAGHGCPASSKLGTMRAKSPAISDEAEGSVYLATPYDNPFGSLMALYVVARIPDRGILVKAAGEVSPDERTGRLVAKFDTSVNTAGVLAAHDGLPQVPIGSLTVKLRQGPGAPLATPASCGTYEIGARVVPWSAPGTAVDPLLPLAAITNGFDGGACPGAGPPPFSPAVVAGSENNDAGAYTPLDIHLSRNDGEQEITRLSMRLPQGLTANLSGVPFCSDAQIAAAKTTSGASEETEPSCPAATQIGDIEASAGVGSLVATVPGRLYMAGPYHGAPFSVVAITRAKVGPFDLGTVVIREALEIDPLTGVATVDASASDPIPHIIKGVVVHLREVRVAVNRQGFALNPTNCEPLAFGASVDGAGADPLNPADQTLLSLAVPFRVTACQALAFKPRFTVSTAGRTSKQNGASLSVKLAFPNAPLGTKANVAYARVELPLQLPSRLTTLQKACLDRVFNANPAACPRESIVGHATAVTPILPVPLSGPAYFVSHGNAKFPELIMVLQGYGVTIELHGETFISKKGITSSTFHTVPDEPVSSFELTLPQGPFSALASNANLCKSRAKLKMPTTLKAQNGIVFRQTTRIAVSGCPRHKTVKLHRRRRRHTRR